MERHYYEEIKAANLASGKNDTVQGSLHFADNGRLVYVDTPLDFLTEHSPAFPTMFWQLQAIKD